MPGVFVNYRVGDVAPVASMIREELVRRFGAAGVFQDRDSIPAGSPYPEELKAGLARSTVLLVVIGPRWLSFLRDECERDWVRWEIEQAIELGMTLIPVLVDDTLPPTADQLPPSIRTAAWPQAMRVGRDTPGADIAEVVDAVAEYDPELACAELFSTMPPLPADPPPSTLLRPEYGVVPFAGRVTELDQLSEWATGPERVSAWLVAGAGGAGKTRLATELCRRLDESGWLTGFLRSGRPESVLSRCALMPAPLLLVIDYAETRLAELLSLVAALADGTGPRHPVRLLLLARSTRGVWLHRLASEELTDRQADVLSSLWDGSYAEPSVERRLLQLLPLLPAESDRQVEFDRAVAAFTGRLGWAAEGVPAPADLEHERYERPLDVHAAALASLLDHPQDRLATPGWRDPIEHILRHERRYWTAAAQKAALPSTDPERLDQIAAAATLFGAGDDDQAMALLRTLPRLAGKADADILDYLSWYQSMYPGPPGLNPLQPDRLGEEHVAATVQRDPQTLHRPATTVDTAQLSQALTVLGRAAPRHERLTGTLSALFDQEPDHRARLGLAVLSRLPDPAALVQAMRGVVGKVELATLDELIDTMDGMPNPSLVTDGLDVSIAARALAIHQQNASPQEVIARTLVSYCRYLSEAGLWSQAQHSVIEAVSLLRTARRPFDLVRALGEQARLLFAVGRYEDAAAVATEAVEVSPDQRTRSAAQLRLASVLEPLDRHGEAVRAAGDAVDSYRTLPSEYHGELAMALTVLARNLAAAGQPEQSVAASTEAGQLLAGLVERSPARYLPQLALHQVQAAQSLLAAGRPAEAELAAQEAVCSYQELVSQQPDLRRTELADAMDQLAVTLALRGLFDQAHDVLTRLVQLRHQLTQRAPIAQTPLLARSLRLLADLHRRVDRELGYRTAAESVSYYQRLPADAPIRQRAELADLQDALASWYGADGHYDQAMAAAATAVAAGREHLAEAPLPYGANLVMYLHTRADLLQHRLRDDDAAHDHAEAVQTARDLAAHAPDRHQLDLAAALERSGMFFVGTERPDPARRCRDEQLRILADGGFVAELAAAQEWWRMFGLD